MNGGSTPAGRPVPRLLPGVGLPVGAIIQYAYTVADIDAEIAKQIEVFGIGPWFKLGPFTPPEARYRGEPTTMTVTIARAFAGTTMMELVAQHDDAPSVYREVIERRGHGFHHFAITSDDLDADVARFAARGYAVCFEDRMPSGGRITYVDATGDLPGMVEIIEMTPAQEQKFAAFKKAAENWDGFDPIRVG